MLFVPEAVTVIYIGTFFRSWQLRNDLRKLNGWANFTLRQAFLIEMGGIRCTPSINFRDLPALIQQYPNEFESAFEQYPTDAMIDGRSKSDTMAKLIGTLQAASFAAGTLFRLADHSSLSLLEVLTAGYVLCGTVSALTCLKWPQDLHEAFQITLPAPKEAKLEAAQQWANLSHNRDVTTARWTFAFLMLLMALFNAIHLAAWNYSFPSLGESIAWKVAVLIDLVVGLGFVWDMMKRDFGPVGLSLTLIYGICRMFIIIESFISLRAAPEAIYQRPSWTAYIGHVGS